MAEEAALTITVCPQEPAHRGRLLLFERNGRARSFGAIPRETWIDQERTRLAEHFYSIRLGLGKSAGVIDPVVGGEALRRIYGLGALWMHELLGTDIKRTRELTSFMRSLVPDWGSRRGPFRVEVRHSDEGNEIAAAIPFENPAAVRPDRDARADHQGGDVRSSVPLPRDDGDHRARTPAARPQ